MAEYIWRCDLSKQYKRYKHEIDHAIEAVLKKGVYILGKEVESFEKEFAKYIGRSYAVSVGSGTDALMLALKTGGIKHGDEVIISAYAPTPVATATVLAGGVPVFTDIEEDTCLINPLEIEKKVTKKTKFVIPVHLFGYVCDMSAIRRIARKNGLTVIEDAAQAHGSMFGEKKAGTFGELSCLSFYPSKNLGAYGDGGIVLTDDKRLRDKMRLLRNYGKRYNPSDSEMVGYNSRLDELQAAILRVKLRHLDEMNRQRSTLVDIYKRGLEGMPIKFLREYPDTKPNYHILTVLCKDGRDDLAKFLESYKIQTNIYYPRPLQLMNAFKRYLKKGQSLPVSRKVSRQALALPLYPELGVSKVYFVIEMIKKYFNLKDGYYGYKTARS